MPAPVGGITGCPVHRLDGPGQEHFNGAEHTLELGYNFGLQVKHCSLFSLMD
jgi:hypothetical protein